jgi:hypothetical protein
MHSALTLINVHWGKIKLIFLLTLCLPHTFGRALVVQSFIPAVLAPTPLKEHCSLLLHLYDDDHDDDNNKPIRPT